MAAEREEAQQSCEDFVPYFVEWCVSVERTHTPFVAVDGESVVGMAWLARLPRSPRPGPTYRFDGDLQTVFVVPEHRNGGVGAGLVDTVLRHAWAQGIAAVSVSSSTRAVSLYQRCGFTGLPPHLRISKP